VWVIAAILIAICLGIWAAVRFSQSTTATAIPVLSPPGGTYTQARSVAITDATPNAVIHYTKDGSPLTEVSPIYFLPISSLPSGTVVRAMATATGHTPSADVTGEYIWSTAAQPTATPQATTPTAAGITAYDQGKAAYDHKDYTKARALFAQACDGDELNACNYLGYIYANGLGIPPDAVTARKIYQKSCDGGHPRGCIGLGILDQNDKKYAEARNYFKQACDGGVKEGCEYLRGVQ
jgi:hypothetical protein